MFLEGRGLRYVRLADDFSVYVKSKVAARRVGSNIYLFLKQKLHLPINREKSGISRPVQFTILGCAYTTSYEKGTRGKYQFIVMPSIWEDIKAKLKALTRKTTPIDFEERISRVNQVIRGWINYFKQASIYSKLKDLDAWLRKRLRSCIWHHRKKPEWKRKNLIRLGVKPDIAYAWSRTSMVVV